MSKLQNERLKKYIEAEEAILSGQSYTIGNRTLAGATVDGEETSGGSTKRIVLLD